MFEQTADLFEQTMLLIKETLHTVSYYLRENTLTTLIDITSKVEEIIGDPRIKLDMPKIRLFGDKFEDNF